LAGYLRSNGFTANAYDICIFKTPQDSIIIGVYVDMFFLYCPVLPHISITTPTLLSIAFLSSPLFPLSFPLLSTPLLSSPLLPSLYLFL
jgi:hypothetical protein